MAHQHPTVEEATAEVVRAAVSWHVHHSPLDDRADNSSADGRRREQMRAVAVQQLHAAVVALLAVHEHRAGSCGTEQDR